MCDKKKMGIIELTEFLCYAKNTLNFQKKKKITYT